jgi:hypothetical protein
MAQSALNLPETDNMMTLSLKELLLILVLTAMAALLNLLFAIPIWLQFLFVMSIAVLCCAIPALITSRKHRRLKKWIDQFDGRITFNKDGLLISKPSDELFIGWKNVVRIELRWEENPWGDPLFGRYCDTDWLLWSDSGRTTSITESVNTKNSQILLKAFEDYLPGFKFDYGQFQITHKNRLFELEGGKATVWVRDLQPPT